MYNDFTEPRAQEDGDVAMSAPLSPQMAPRTPPQTPPRTPLKRRCPSQVPQAPRRVPMSRRYQDAVMRAYMETSRKLWTHMLRPQTGLVDADVLRRCMRRFLTDTIDAVHSDVTAYALVKARDVYVHEATGAVVVERRIFENDGVAVSPCLAPLLFPECRNSVAFPAAGGIDSLRQALSGDKTEVLLRVRLSKIPQHTRRHTCLCGVEMAGCIVPMVRVEEWAQATLVTHEPSKEDIVGNMLNHMKHSWVAPLVEEADVDDE